MLSLRVEPSPETVKQFCTDFLHPYDWPVEEIAKCILFRVERSGTPIAYVWYECVDSESSLFSVHVCVDPRFKGRWLNRRLIRGFVYAAELAGINGLLFFTDGSPTAKFGKVIGWTPMNDDVAFLPIPNHWSK